MTTAAAAAAAGAAAAQGRTRAGHRPDVVIPAQIALTGDGRVRLDEDRQGRWGGGAAGGVVMMTGVMMTATVTSIARLFPPPHLHRRWHW